MSSFSQTGSAVGNLTEVRASIHDQVLGFSSEVHQKLRMDRGFPAMPCASAHDQSASFPARSFRLLFQIVPFPELSFT